MADGAIQKWDPWHPTDIPLGEGECVDGRHKIAVMAYLFGQYRIWLTDSRQANEYALPGHGSIVRELCTYQHAKAEKIVAILGRQKFPVSFCAKIERPWNCDMPGGRIRLDNQRDGDDE